MVGLLLLLLLLLLRLLVPDEQRRWEIHYALSIMLPSSAARKTPSFKRSPARLGGSLRFLPAMRMRFRYSTYAVDGEGNEICTSQCSHIATLSGTNCYNGDAAVGTERACVSTT